MDTKRADEEKFKAASWRIHSGRRPYGSAWDQIAAR